jgi:hypothetical protein
MVFSGATDTMVFRGYVEQVLLPDRLSGISLLP